MTAPLKTFYDKTVKPELEKEAAVKNPNALPKLEKITLNIGIGSRVTQGQKDYSHIEENLMKISGQKPALRKARVSVSNFKLREGMPVGLAVTLRGRQMYDFIERLIKVALPRVRDFQGIPAKGFDGNGNFSMGLKDVTIFPEINVESLSQSHGLQVNIITTTDSDEAAYKLLKSFGFPFKGQPKSLKKSN